MTYWSSTFVHKSTNQHHQYTDIPLLLYCLCQRTVIHKCHIEGSKHKRNNIALSALLWASLTVSLVTQEHRRRCGNFGLQEKWCGHMCPCDIDPDSEMGQVLTQGQQPALMTIDNNLSLFDFQPNSLLERGNHCLKTASKWSKVGNEVRKLRFDKTPQSQFDCSCQTTVYIMHTVPSSCWACSCLSFFWLFSCLKLPG